MIWHRVKPLTNQLIMNNAVRLFHDLLIQPAERIRADEWLRTAIRVILFSSELSMTYSQEAQVTLESDPEVLFLRQYVKRVPVPKIPVRIYPFVLRPNSHIYYQSDTSGWQIFWIPRQSFPEVRATFLITTGNWGKREEFKKSEF